MPNDVSTPTINEKFSSITNKIDHRNMPSSPSQINNI